MLQIRNAKQQLLNIIKNLSSSGFEKLCKRLLTEVGIHDVKITEDDVAINFVDGRIIFQAENIGGRFSTRAKKQGSTTNSLSLM